MKDESVIFTLLKQELASILSIDDKDISLDSSLEDLGVYSDDLECALTEVQDVLFPDSEITSTNAFVDCETIQDVVDSIIDFLSATE